MLNTYLKPLLFPKKKIGRKEKKIERKFQGKKTKKKNSSS